jgi:hypothetical protein
MSMTSGVQIVWSGCLVSLVGPVAQSGRVSGVSLVGPVTQSGRVGSVSLVGLSGQSGRSGCSVWSVRLLSLVGPIAQSGRVVWSVWSVRLLSLLLSMDNIQLYSVWSGCHRGLCYPGITRALVRCHEGWFHDSTPLLNASSCEGGQGFQNR